MSTRRNVLKMFGAAPLAARQAGEAAAKALAGVGVNHGPPISSLGDQFGLTNGVAGSIGQASNNPNTVSSVLNFQSLKENAIRAVLSTKEGRGEVESILYEQYRHIGAFDPDLASNRSYSFAAKIAYQRQRLVARALDTDIL